MSGRIILVTGGNRGIGLEIVRGILKRASHDHPFTVLIGCRKLDNYADAAAELTSVIDGQISKISSLEIDVTSDSSISSAFEQVKHEYGRLDVLIHNAGVGIIPKDASEIRKAVLETFDANVASVAVITEVFLPLLYKSNDPRIIMTSSARGSYTRSADPTSNPTVAAVYNASKSALNMLTLEYNKRFARPEKGNPIIKVWSCSPGFTKTRFNGFRGTKDPAEAAIPNIELAVASKKESEKYEGGRMFEYEQDSMQVVPW
jgi:NAD(P)-dependent dehydrogenase (short-subunit alcohol dehydrogenase family)